MEFRLALKSDSYNTYPFENLEITDTEERVYLKIGDREVSVMKSELIKVIKVIAD